MGEEDFILELIISNVELATTLYREKSEPKKPRFAEPSDIDQIYPETDSKNNLTSESNFNLDGPMDPGTGDVIVRMRAFRLPNIDVVEDQSKDTTREKSETKKKQLDATDEPKYKKSAMKVGENDALLSKKFKKGKSYLFPMNYNFLMKNMHDKDILLTMLRDSIDEECVGSVKIDVPESFFAAVLAAHRSSMLRQMTESNPIFPDIRLHKKLLKERRDKYRCPCPQKKEKPFDPYDTERLMKMEPFATFKDYFTLPPGKRFCEYCDGIGCGCGAKTLSGCKAGRTKASGKRSKRRHRLNSEELMDPSPEAIEPEPLPICASLDKRVIFVDKTGRETAHGDVFIRLSCFGTSLRYNPGPFPECSDDYEVIPYDEEQKDQLLWF